MSNETDGKKDEQTTSQAINLDTVKAFLESDEDGKKYLQSLTDAKVTKALKTYETETVPKLVEKKVKDLYPEETEDQKKMRQLALELESIRNEAKREKMQNIALSEATKRGLPTNLVKYFVGTDEDTTLKNVEEFEKEYFSTVNTQVQEQFKVGGRRVPQQSNDTTGTISHEDVRNMSSEEFLKHQDAIKRSLSK